MSLLEHPDEMLVSLIAAGTEEHVPSGVPFGTVPLPSLDTDEVREWLRKNQAYTVYVIAGTEHQSPGVPAITISASQEDYERVLSAMPR
jgi:hypothetical protein